MSYRAWIIGSLGGLVWRVSARARESAAARFAQIERDSAHQFLFAAEVAGDARLKAQLLVNSLDEHRHAEWFERCAPAAAVRAALPASRRQLVSELGGLERFLAYAAVSEKAVSTEFGAYARAFGSPELEQLFEKIRVEEEQHGSSCSEPLSLFVESPAERRRLLRWAGRQRIAESLRRSGNALGGALASLALALIYVLLCYWVRGAARRRLEGARSGAAPRAPERQLGGRAGGRAPAILGSGRGAPRALAHETWVGDE